MRLWETIKANRLPDETARGNVQCMTSYWRVFGTCRIPKPGRDKLFTCVSSKHILVISNNHMYKLNVYDSEGLPSSPVSLEKALDEIHQHSLRPHYIQDGMGTFITLMIYLMLLRSSRRWCRTVDMRESRFLE